MKSIFKFLTSLLRLPQIGLLANKQAMIIKLVGREATERSNLHLQLWRKEILFVPPILYVGALS